MKAGLTSETQCRNHVYSTIRFKAINSPVALHPVELAILKSRAVLVDGCIDKDLDVGIGDSKAIVNKDKDS